jgi:hypothetical protein
MVASNGVLHPAMLEVIARYQAAYQSRRSVNRT